MPLAYAAAAEGVREWVIDDVPGLLGTALRRLFVATKRAPEPFRRVLWGQRTIAGGHDHDDSTRGTSA